MNAADVLKWGHSTLLNPLEGIPESKWEVEGVCGWWSVKNIVAHLTSYELVLIDVLNSFLGGGPALYLDRYQRDGFNDSEVATRKDRSPRATLDELNGAHVTVMSLIGQIPIDRQRSPGALAWYGAEYDLEDFIAYSYYGHKREHAAQINVFKDTLK